MDSICQGFDASNLNLLARIPGVELCGWVLLMLVNNCVISSYTDKLPAQSPQSSAPQECLSHSDSSERENISM